VKTLGMLDTYWALIIPAIASPYNLLIMISFTSSLSPTFEESARMDGASDFRTFTHIILPLCKPMLASIGLFTAVAYWNDFFRPLIFIHKDSMYTLALYLRQVLNDSNEINKTLDTAVYGSVAPESVQNATIIISTLPILLVYPFVQRFFVTGITLGGVKE
jgi:putative aldouronate transport system permease protein